MVLEHVNKGEKVVNICIIAGVWCTVAQRNVFPDLKQIYPENRPPKHLAHACRLDPCADPILPAAARRLPEGGGEQCAGLSIQSVGVPFAESLKPTSVQISLRKNL